MRHVYNGTDFINYVLCEICTTKPFVICVLYFVRNDRIKMFNQSITMPATQMTFTSYCRLLGGFQTPEGIWNPPSKTVLGECSSFGIKDSYTSELTVKLKSNLYFGPVDIFLIFNTIQKELFSNRIWSKCFMSTFSHPITVCFNIFETNSSMEHLWYFVSLDKQYISSIC